jgi:hypothetical protein
MAESRVTTLRFTTRMELRGINPFVLVSAARAKRIQAGWRKPLPVLVRINGEPAAKPWRINMMPAGDGTFYLYLHGDVRRASGTGVGDRVRVEVEFDAGYRGGPLTPMPRELRAALTRDVAATRAWKALTPSRKKEVVRYLVALKSSETLNRNVVKFVDQLSGRAKRGPILRQAP